METERGIVVELKDGMALVEADAGGGCASCASRGSCALMAGEQKRRLWMANGAGAKPGDMVEFSISARVVAGMSLLLYAMPVALLVCGIAAGAAFAPRLGMEADAGAVLFGVGAFALSFGIIKAFSSTISVRKASRPVMIRVLGTGELAGETVKKGWI